MAVSYFTLSILLIFSVSVEAKCGSRVIAHDRQDSVNMTFQLDKPVKGVLIFEHLLQTSPHKVDLAIKVNHTWDIIIEEKVRMQETNDRMPVAILRHVSANDAGVYRLTRNSKPLCSVTLLVTRAPVVSLKHRNRSLTCNAKTTSKPDGHHLPMMYGWFINEQVMTGSTSPILTYRNLEAGTKVTCTATDDFRCEQFLNTINTITSWSQILSSEACTNVLGWSKPYERKCLQNSECSCPSRDVGVCRHGKCTCVAKSKPTERDGSSTVMEVEGKCGSRVIAHYKQDSVNMTFQLDKSVKGMLILEHLLQTSQIKDLALKLNHTWDIINKEKLQMQETNDRMPVAILRHVDENDAGVYRLTRYFKPLCSVTLLVTRAPVVSLKYRNRRLTCDTKTTSKPDGHHLPMIYGWFIDEQFMTRSTSPILTYDKVLAGTMVTCTATDDFRCDEFLKTVGNGTRLSLVLSSEACTNVLGWSKPHQRKCLQNSECLCSSGGVCRHGKCTCIEESKPAERDGSSTVVEGRNRIGYIIGGVTSFFIVAGLVVGALFLLK